MMRVHVCRLGINLLIASLLLVSSSPTVKGYSVLSHEAVVDSAWDSSIKPLLLARYPTASPEQLREAHAYAYGGCIIQDMGYYPFGSHFFSNLLHYVRSGDFVRNLLDESQDMYEFAFALGALAHYKADNTAHPEAVNVSVPLLYPRLHARYGNHVTYEEDPSAHVMTEFGFDVVQVAGGRFVPQSYRDFIGFEVSKPLLERAFKSTYGLDIRDVLLSEDLAIGTFRHTASKTIPQMTKVAWEKKKEQILQANPGIKREHFVYRLSASEYRSAWGSQYEKPGTGAKILAFLFTLLPKIGPLKTFKFKVPTAEAERLYRKSFAETSTRYKGEINEVAKRQSLTLPVTDLDTGEPTRSGEYRLADQTYGQLVDKLARNHFAGVTPDLQAQIVQFYANLNQPNARRRDPKLWQKTVQEVDELRAMRIPAANPIEERTAAAKPLN
jgi:hypothetical protein